MQRFPDNILTGNPLRGMFIDHLMTLPSSFPHFPRDFGSKHLMHMFPAGRTVGNAYGFALGMHCKDMENAMEAIRAPHSDGKSFSMFTPAVGNVVASGGIYGRYLQALCL